MRPDWKKIRYDYITSTKSYRDISKEYNVSFNTIAKRAKREGWYTLRKNNDNKVTLATLEVHNQTEVQRNLGIIETADVLLRRLNNFIDLNPDMDIRDLRQCGMLLSVLKDSKNLNADIREQEAKIKNLEKQASEESPIVAVEFRMPEGLEDLAE